jgi:hypothetical protein
MMNFKRLISWIIFYDYESDFATIMKGLSKEVLEKQLSELPADRRKKKHSPNLGK